MSLVASSTPGLSPREAAAATWSMLPDVYRGGLDNAPMGEPDGGTRIAYLEDALAAAKAEGKRVFVRRMPDAKVHMYGKGERAGRKLGHVNIVGRAGEDAASVRERANRAAHWLSHAEWTDGWSAHD